MYNNCSQALNQKNPNVSIVIEVLLVKLKKQIFENFVQCILTVFPSNSPLIHPFPYPQNLVFSPKEKKYKRKHQLQFILSVCLWLFNSFGAWASYLDHITKENTFCSSSSCQLLGGPHLGVGLHAHFPMLEVLVS